ncbi:hypothetical protein RCO28_09750 [Streptomyces sp. LHD-70]|uniref:hypothetical protein n=1 Tax=Streptomyces sp. LHD-70 TaxID=3072140 RepID=UPI0028109354|nr:hypothetical protein [Streptomyces sp. LHD-70]MDQ8702771.1 hypothetical protein [Streptomyces sp. LHD-70]
MEDTAAGERRGAADDDGPPPGPGTGEPDLAVAVVVYRVGRELGASDKVLLSSFEAALVESGMENLDHGLEDSLGVFQQRPSQGWGSPEQVTNVAYAARQFFTRALTVEGQDPSLTPGELAQAVQVSAYPERYDQREAEARELIARTEQEL